MRISKMTIAQRHAKREADRKYVKKHRKKMAEKTKAWRLRNPEKRMAQREKQKKEDPNRRKCSLEFFRMRRAVERDGIRMLSDFYVRRKLSIGTNVHWRKWPDAVVELKRAILKLQRSTKY